MALNQCTVYAGTQADRIHSGVAAGVGGGLFVAGGTLTLDQSTVADNSAFGSDGYTLTSGMTAVEQKGVASTSPTAWSLSTRATLR